VEILKAMGSNAIRTAHNAPSPEFLDICNRLGMLVMDEAFDCWETGKVRYDYGRFFRDWSETDIRGQVRRDRNNPCVIMWSIGNEIYGPTVSTAENLMDWARMEDRTRPITWASNHMRSSDHQQVAAILDIAGYNYWRNGYYPDDHSAHPDRIILGSETCAARRSRETYVFPPSRNFGNLDPDIGSGYDNSFGSGGINMETDWKAHMPDYVAGVFPWTGFDYLGENHWPTINNNDGIIDRCGFPKDAYYFYQSQWTDAPMVHILPHWNWNEGDEYLTAPNGTNIESNVISGEFDVPVWVYSNCESVELFLNDQSLGVRESGANGDLHLEWTVPFAAGTLRAVGTRDGNIAAVDSVSTAGAPAKIVLSADRGAMKADGEDLMFITADVVDGNGVIHPRAENTIEFSIDGPGTIVGVDNGNSMDHAAYLADTRRAFGGKCLAVVRSSGTSPSKITVTAMSSGLASGSVSFNSEVTPIRRARRLDEQVLKYRPATILVNAMSIIHLYVEGGPAEVSLHDLKGKLMGTARILSGLVDIQKDFDVSKGCYLLRIQN
jgi:beta-galactosidase